MRKVQLLLLAIFSVLFASACTRTKYRTAADRDSYQILREKSPMVSTPLPAGYAVRPDVRSRFYDPTNPDCPQLPTPRPVLNAYTLPPLATDQQNAESEILQVPLEEVPPTPADAVLPAPTSAAFEQHDRSRSDVSPASYSDQPIVTIATDYQTSEKSEAPSAPKSPNNANNSIGKKVTIPTQAWEVLPESCLNRMLEFNTLREEYAQSYGEEKSIPSTANERHLTLANLMELASINSREYQTRKETLFRAALALTRQRYQFELNPTPFGNGSAAIYQHARAGGITNDRLSVPSGVGVQQTMASAGQFLARFANTIVLTFNGPSGFAADVGSEMVYDFQQTLFQRDVRFEFLTQTERDVVYAMRDYLRFRKQLFRDIANQYYNLLLNYRRIEINAQDYFTNLRGFIQSQTEYRTAEKISRIQVDQFEQNVLRARSNLVGNCFALEASLDQFKFRVGLPVEMTIYLDLAELESISLKDELSVARQMINRARNELMVTKSINSMDATSLANVAEVLADRMSSILRIQRRMDEAAKDSSAGSIERPGSQAIDRASRELIELQQLLQILGVRMQVDLLRMELLAQLDSETPAPPLRILIRAIEFSSSEMQVINLALESPQLKNEPRLNEFRQRRDRAASELDAFITFIEELSANLGSKGNADTNNIFDLIPEKMRESVELVDRLEKLAKDATRDFLPEDTRRLESLIQNTVDRTIELSDRLLEKGPDGWEEIQIDSNEAMLTGLVQRLDLMNQRGELADAWRQIKLAGDDLRSIVDLRATHTLRTKRSANDPFDFTLDDSETRLSMALDTPLNRRLQRNIFRLALINYNAGIRNLMAAEDSIKLDVREDLRQLALDRNQYTISIASAALAYERVISTRLRLQLAIQNVAARDFLEAQQAYTNALLSTAQQHVNYIQDRLELFFDLEAFNVDEYGHWSGVSEDYGPNLNLDFPGTNPRPYDSLPPRVWYSPTIRQMEQIRPGEATIR
jgi:hypothetical protein